MSVLDETLYEFTGSLTGEMLISFGFLEVSSVQDPWSIYYNSKDKCRVYRFNPPTSPNHNGKRYMIDIVLPGNIVPTGVGTDIYRGVKRSKMLTCITYLKDLKSRNTDWDSGNYCDSSSIYLSGDLTLDELGRIIQCCEEKRYNQLKTLFNEHIRS